MRRIFYAPCLLCMVFAFGALALKAEDQQAALRVASAQGLFEAYQDSAEESDSALAGMVLDQLKSADSWYQLAISGLPKKATTETVGKATLRHLAFAKEHAKAANWIATQLVARHPVVAMAQTEAAPKKRAVWTTLELDLLARANWQIEQIEAMGAACEALTISTKAYLLRALREHGGDGAAQGPDVQQANAGLRAANEAAAINPDAERLFELCIELNAKFAAQLRAGHRDWSMFHMTELPEERKAMASLAEKVIDLSVKRGPKEKEAYMKENGLLKLKRARPHGFLGVVGEPKPHTVERSAKTLAEWQAFFGVAS
ncbi:MAG: hypothetical protein HY559_03295 [Gammaproteobacteria bacterium]|nr:hypothetical protein [Gammaproteobacteria bacterium]